MALLCGIIIIIAIFILSLPCWLPRVLIKLRTLIFVWANGKRGVHMPSTKFTADDYKQAYAHPAASGRSEGAPLSDLFWYWLSPGAEIHQEHLENGPRYKALSSFTFSLLARLPKNDLLRKLDIELPRFPLLIRGKSWQVKRLYKTLMNVWADFFYQLVFQEKCPSVARALIVEHAYDVISSLRCRSLRHMKRRYALSKFLEKKLTNLETKLEFPEGFSTLEKVYFYKVCFLILL